MEYFLGRKYCYNKYKFNDTCEFKSYNKVEFRFRIILKGVTSLYLEAR